LGDVGRSNPVTAGDIVSRRPTENPNRPVIDGELDECERVRFTYPRRCRRDCGPREDFADPVCQFDRAGLALATVGTDRM
jgi:hypothetical protein